VEGKEFCRLDEIKVDYDGGVVELERELKAFLGSHFIVSSCEVKSSYPGRMKAAKSQGNWISVSRSAIQSCQDVYFIHDISFRSMA